MDIERFLPFLPLLLSGLQTTLLVFALSAVLATAFAVVAGIARHAAPVWLGLPFAVTVEVFRGTACFVQLFWVFYALPMFGVTLSPVTASVIVLGLNVGSYGSEVVRGALRAVPQGQIEAAKALNYSRTQSMVHIVAPQALRIAIRPAANLFVDLLKLTPLTSLVTVADLTRNAMVMRNQTGSTLATLLCIFVVYFLLASLIYAAMDRLERRLNRGAAVPSLQGAA